MIGIRSALAPLPAQVGRVAEESFDESGFAGPGGHQDFAGDLSTRIAQGECDHDDVIEGSDDGQELWDEVDWAGHPESGDEDGDLCPAWHSGVFTKPSDGGDAVGDEGCEITQDAGWEPACEQDQQCPRGGQ